MIKLTLTKEELIKHLNYGNELKIEDIEVTGLVFAPRPLLLYNIVKIVPEIFPGYELDQKIAAIKLLRSLIFAMELTIGIAHAKFAVENWSRWVGYVSKYNTIPAFITFEQPGC